MAESSLFVNSFIRYHSNELWKRVRTESELFARVNSAQSREGPDSVGAAEEESGEAQGEDGMAEAGAEVLPEGDGGAGVVGREEQRKHEDQPAEAGGPHEDAEDQRETDGEFAIGHEESDGRGVRQNKAAKYRRHEGIRAAFGEEFADPELEPAVKRELRAEDFVFTKIEKEEAYGYAERGEGAGVASVMGERHCWMIVKRGCGEKKKI